MALRLLARAPADPLESARRARLRYVSDRDPGIRRLGRPGHFRYVDERGRRARPADLARIRALAIPPAWTDVWICARADGHLQAAGRDARGRKQYRYHRRWREVRDATKYHKLLAFGRALPRIRRAVQRDLTRPGLSRERVLAAVVRLLETSLIRVGNEEYTRANHSFGLTTLRDHHVDVDGSELRFQFRGKSGKWRSVRVEDRRLARVVARCQELPGHELFQYLDESGRRHSVDSSDVNEYLRAISGQDFTAKDFRTWAGTVCAIEALGDCAPCSSQAAARRNVAHAIDRVAARLGNTRAVCLKCYVHPDVTQAYYRGELPAGRHPTDSEVVALLRRLSSTRKRAL